jgi:hypothetical protein
MANNDLKISPERVERYYEKMGMGHDFILRCKDCQSIETFQHITALGCCSKCGNKRFAEITLLNEKEMAMIKSGEISFPESDKFLAEFSGVEL